jgi:serine/threonine protein phosphatase PrpC
MENSYFTLIKNEAMEAPQASPFLGGTIVYFSSPFSGYDNKNQDSIAAIQIDPFTGVLIVADGIGGARGGDLASSSIIDTFNQILQNTGPKELLEKALSICQQASNEVKNLNIGAGSTITALFIHRDKGILINCGDSPAFHFSATGQEKRRTIRFSVGGFMEQLQIKPAETPKRLINEKNHLINYTGSEAPSFYVQGPFEINPRDKFLLCSDGISENIDDSFLTSTISENEIQAKAQKILSKARVTMSGDSGCPDDHSFILLDLSKVEVETQTD